jgi:hypothetical protein
MLVIVKTRKWFGSLFSTRKAGRRQHTHAMVFQVASDEQVKRAVEVVIKRNRQALITLKDR